MLKVIVDRKKWCRGRRSALRTIEGTYCCLGFASLAAGLSDDDINKVPSIASLAQSTPIPPTLRLLYDCANGDFSGAAESTTTAVFLMSCNDAASIDDDKRERKIIKLGRAAEIEFTFVN